MWRKMAFLGLVALTTLPAWGQQIWWRGAQTDEGAPTEKLPYIQFTSHLAYDPDVMTTQAIGEEGGRNCDPLTTAEGEQGGGEGCSGPITLAEEETGSPPGDDPIYTTMALGEEGGKGGNNWN